MLVYTFRSDANKEHFTQAFHFWPVLYFYFVKRGCFFDVVN